MTKGACAPERHELPLQFDNSLLYECAEHEEKEEEEERPCERASLYVHGRVAPIGGRQKIPEPSL